MVRQIGGEGMRQAAIEFAQKAAQQQQKIESRIPDSIRTAIEGPEKAGFDASLESVVQKGLANVDMSVDKVDSLPQVMTQGKIEDFHEIAGQLKRSELTFKFALAVRNKLIDAYREVMRMSV